MAANRTTEIATRCPWAGTDPLYVRYHDTEWGVPLTDDRALFEKLVLEGFQSGLSWITILRKRENFRRAFDNFDIARIARYRDKDIARLMADEGIVRNRLKIEATIENSRACIKLAKHEPLSHFIWRFFKGGPLQNTPETMADIPAQTPLSTEISKALKREGFRFVGPTTIYAFMQSSGMVNDHLFGCPRHAACARLHARLKIPGSDLAT